MKTLKTLALATAVSAGLLGSVGAMAAASADRDSGQFTITLFNETLIEVYGLKDVELVKDDTAPFYEVTAPVCVAANVNTYRMKLSSDNSFKFGGNDALEYSVELQLDGGAAVPGNKITKWGKGGLLSDTYSEAVLTRDADNTNGGCSSEQTYQFDITLDNGSTAAAGLLTDAVTVTVEPI